VSFDRPWMDERYRKPHPNVHNSFGGVPALQRWGDFALWEVVLNMHPELRGIVELGTYMGGFSRYLGFQALMRAMRFHTFDLELPAKPLGAHTFVKLDLWSEKAPAVVREFLGRPGILLCDDGDKPREVATFAPILEPGELLVVHDWGLEIGAGDIPASLEMVHEDDAEALNSISRVFRRR